MAKLSRKKKTKFVRYVSEKSMVGATLLVETDDAYCFLIGRDKRWAPKSCVEIKRNGKGQQTFHIEESFIEDKWGMRKGLLRDNSKDLKRRTGSYVERFEEDDYNDDNYYEDEEPEEEEEEEEEVTQHRRKRR